MAFNRVLKRFSSRKDSSRLEFTEFVPPSRWTEESSCYYLLVNLPGFKEDDVKLQVDNYNQLIVSGERQISPKTPNKYIRFEQKFNVPEKSDINNITGKFEGEVLKVTVPKQNIYEDGKKQDNDKHDVGNGYYNLHHKENKTPKEEGFNEEGGVLESEMKMVAESVMKSELERLMKMVGIVLTAVLIICLGVLLVY